jgi:hypothetical protein
MVRRVPRRYTSRLQISMHIESSRMGTIDNRPHHGASSNLVLYLWTFEEPEAPSY